VIIQLLLTQMILSCFTFSSSTNTHAVHFLVILITVHLPECQHLPGFTQQLANSPKEMYIFMLSVGEKQEN